MYVLCYVDDVLCISDYPMTTMQGIQKKFKLIFGADHTHISEDRFKSYDWFDFSGTYYWQQRAVSLSDYRRLVLSIGDPPVGLVPEHMHVKLSTNYPPKRACQLFLPILAL